MDTIKVAHLSEKNPPIAKQSSKDRLKDLQSDPWKGLREKPGVVIESMARRRP